MYEESDEKVTVSAEKMCVIYNKRSGRFEKMVYQDKNFWEDEGEQFFRAPTGIDKGMCDKNPSASYENQWRSSGLDHFEKRINNVKVLKSEYAVSIREKSQIVADGKKLLETDTIYTVGSNGIEINRTVRNESCVDTLARIGHCLKLPKEFIQVEWYGRGPWENYADRKTAALIGCYRSTPQEMHVPYICPGECGGREQVRYVMLTDGERVLTVTGGNDFHFSALPYSMNQYAGAEYEEELGESQGTYLMLDAYHAGLGGDTGWNCNIHPEYRIGRGIYTYRFILEMK